MENRTMDSRVYGVLGISSIMANWNADFTGYPKTLSDGTVFGSDKALKYPMKKMWDDEGQKVVYIKSLRFLKERKKEDGKMIEEIVLVPKLLKERYEELFHTNDLKKVYDSKEVITNLMTAVDVKNFGATFAESGKNFAITGAVQFGQGLNKYDGTTAEEQNILSPFRKPAKEGEEGKEVKEKRNSSLGTKIVSNEAHYFYPFVINPAAYRELVSLGVTEGYTVEDYQNFKRTALVAVTSYSTNAKEGCENEFAMFVETDPDLYLPNLTEYIAFEKSGTANIIDISKCCKILNEFKERIKKIEIYYNPYTTNLVFDDFDGLKVKYFNIITQNEVS